MQRPLLVIVVVIDVALVCFIVQALVEHNRQRPQANLEETLGDIPPVPKKQDVEEVKASGWGTVRGRIVWAGDKVPERKPIDTSTLKDPEPCLQRFPLLSEEWVVQPSNKGIRWTFVWLAQEPARRNEKLPVHPDLQQSAAREVAIDKPCYAFVPHAVGMRVDQELVLKNSSSVAHLEALLGEHKIAPSAIPNPYEPRRWRLRATTIPSRLVCQVHPWMKGWVGVFEHPYFALTDENGRFEIKRAPAGKYRLKVWHESAGWRGGPAGRFGDRITIQANETTDVGELGLKAN